MAKKKKAGRSRKRNAGTVDRAAKRAEQVAQGAMDGRFRVKVVKSRKRYVRKPIQKEDLEP